MSKPSWCKALVVIAALTLAMPAAAAADKPKQPKPASIKQVGHKPLLNRGMNAAIAINGDYAYIGSRTDRPRTCRTAA